MSFITAVYGTRLFMSLWVNSGFLDKRASWFGVEEIHSRFIQEKMDLMSLPTRFDKIDFVKHQKVFYGISIGVTIIGIIFLLVFRLNLGIDFTSGTRIEIASKNVCDDSASQNRKCKRSVSTRMISRMSGSLDKTIKMLSFGQSVSLISEEIAELKDHFKKDYGAEPNVSTVSPTVGKELAKNAMKALAIASIGIILYVSIRFEWRMAVPAVVALIHDAFFIITIFSLLRLEVDITFIAAVLTIVGYSINDTIVTFDRIRENMRFSRKIKTAEELEEHCEHQYQANADEIH